MHNMPDDRSIGMTERNGVTFFNSGGEERLVSNFIGGRFATSASGRTQDIFNPATGRKSGNVSLSSSIEVNEAVAAAKAAPGVLGVYTIADLKAAGIGPMLVTLPQKNRDGTTPRIAGPIPARSLGPHLPFAGSPAAPSGIGGQMRRGR